MSTKLVSALGIAGLLLAASLADANEAQSRASIQVAQLPAMGGFQGDVNNPSAPRDVSDMPVRIMNYSGQPFRYQVSRTSAKTWSEYYTLPSGQLHQFNADRRDRGSIIRTLNGSGSPGYLFIRFPVPGGFESFKLLGNNAYGFVINNNGYGEIVEPNLAGQPVARVARGAQELQLFQLYSNHCYFDKQPDQPTPAPGPIMPREPRFPRGQ
ncbi:MAG TPA: hypothetical protein VHY20_16180 [Pirellulales bacterium]|jgi:hypothetical protein|nr:hypothetical protein [Pirellulales bacterium]